MKKLALLAAVLFLISASPVMAKEGFYLGVYMPTTKISGDATSVDSGSGLGFRAGIGLNRYFAIEGTYEKTSHDVTGGSTADLKGAAVNAKLNFPLTTLDSQKIMSLEPYAKIGFGSYELSVPGASGTGSGVQYGIGIELYLFRELSINAGWTKTKVDFDFTPEESGDIKTIDIGLMYHFL
jgi:hypothetical protein